MTYVYTPSHKIEISKIHSPSVINYLIPNFQKQVSLLRNKHIEKLLGI